jgi:hypothetical protein
LVWLPWQIYRDGKICTAEPKQDICTCLKTFRECSEWGKVWHGLSLKTDQDILRDPLSYNISFLREKKYTSKISLFKKVLRKIMKVSILNNLSFLTDSIIKKEKEAIDNTLTLYDTIAEKTGKKYIVDSSKDILRAYAIWKMRPELTKIILLHKDAKSYAASGKHWGKSIPVSQNLESWLHEYEKLFIPILKKMSINSTMSIKYNDMTKDPEKTRDRLASFIGVSSSGSVNIDTSKMHIVAGNPMRFKGIINIKYDERWTTELNEEEKKIAEEYEFKMSSLMRFIK